MLDSNIFVLYDWLPVIDVEQNGEPIGIANVIGDEEHGYRVQEYGESGELRDYVFGEREVGEYGLEENVVRDFVMKHFVD